MSVLTSPVFLNPVTPEEEAPVQSSPFAMPTFTLNPVQPVAEPPKTNGTRPAGLVIESKKQSVEDLLTEAETSGHKPARDLAAQIRELVSELVRVVRESRRERQLRATVAELQAKLEAAMAELGSIESAAPQPAEPTIPASSAASYTPIRKGASSKEIRAWAQANGMKVNAIGALSHEVRLAYELAVGDE